MFDDIEPEKNEGLLEAAQRLANEASQIQEQIDDYNLTLKSLNDRKKEIIERELPEMMKEAKISSFTLENGKKISLKEIVAATVPKDERQKRAFFDWLQDEQATDIIKSQVAIAFDRGGHNEALSLVYELQGQGYAAGFDENVYPQTLVKFLRERLENGEDLPPENILSVYLGTHAKIG